MALMDVIGQERAVNILLRTIQRGRLPSSYLFAGESGIGKKFTAINLVKVLNCQKTVNSHQSIVISLKEDKEESEGLSTIDYRLIDCCDDCPSCKKIDSGVHPDFLLVSPEGGQIRIEEIREIDDVLSFKAFEGRSKAVIVDEADTMNPYAANAFLKTLEEPPKDSIIILISSNPDRLPDTIRSRCSRVSFAPLSYDACRKVLERVISQQSAPSPAPQTMALLARLAMGRPGTAIDRDLLEERSWFMKLLREMLNAMKDGWTSKEEMGRWFDFILILLRDMAILKITHDEKNLINNDLKDYISKLSRTMDLKVIIENYQRLNTLKGYFNFNLNMALTWNYTGSLLRRTMDTIYA